MALIIGHLSFFLFYFLAEILQSQPTEVAAVSKTSNSTVFGLFCRQVILVPVLQVIRVELQLLLVLIWNFTHAE
jgi:hypothetical protein